MSQVILPVIIAFLVAFIAAPIAVKLAKKWGVMDAPDDRKVHKYSMPRMGGLAIYAGFLVAVLATQTINTQLIGILIGCTIIVLLGIVDDIKGVSPKVKLAGQTLAALVVVLFGVQISIITNPFADVLFLNALAIPLTILWIVGVTNAVNLIDGLDGLAAGTSGIAAITIGVVALLEGHLAVAILAMILAGSVFGFLPFNFNPAKIFMGDTGSMFLGFTLAVLAVVGLTKSATVISVFIPIVILGIPIFDTMYAIVRRFLNGAPIFKADKEHLHHQLLNMGLTHKQTVLVIYAVNVCLGGSAVLMSLMTPPQAVVILIGVALVMLLAMNRLNFFAFSRREKTKDFKLKRDKAI